MTSEMTLEQLAEKILAAMHAGAREWLKRDEVARLLGKKKLSPRDMAALELASSKGQLSMRAAKTAAPSGKRWEYRIKE